MTLSAPISAKSDSIRYPTVPDPLKQVNDMSKHNSLQDNHRACPPDSKRNPGYYGDVIDHVIEFGSMYHMLEPMDYTSWSLQEEAIEVVLVKHDGKSSYEK